MIYLQSVTRLLCVVQAKRRPEVKILTHRGILLVNDEQHLWFYFTYKFVLFHLQGLLGGKLQVESDDDRRKNDLKM